MSENTLAIIGSFPPPFGGVANHVRRLLPMLSAKDIPYRVYNAVSSSADEPHVQSVARHRRSWLVWFLFSCREAAVYVLSDRLNVWLLAGVIAPLRGKKVALRLRNAQLLAFLGQGRVRSALAAFALRRMHLIVCVNKELRDTVLGLGISPDVTIHAPGFLPPTDKCKDPEGIDPSVWEFVRHKSPLVVANGKVNWHEGVDLYGLDLMVELITRLAADLPTIGLVVCFWNHSPADDDYLQSLRDSLSDRGLSEAVLFNTRQGVFVPLLTVADVFIRPTATDGDANSIREAIAVGVPTVASDVVARPEECRIHANRDLDSLEKHVRIALEESAKSDGTRDLTISRDVKGRIDSYVAALGRLLDPGSASSNQ